MLQVEQLTVQYRGICGLDRVSFAVRSGQLIGVMGPNGAGKSTLLKAMLGLIPVAGGKVWHDDRPLQTQLEKVAYVPQRSQIDWDFPITVWNVVMLARTRQLRRFSSPSRATKQQVSTALERVEMLHLKHRRIGELSGGQQQRVFLARALAQQADLFLFDEPLTGVDQTTEAILLDTFAELRSQGKILLVSSHDWGESLMQLDRLLLLNQRLIVDDTPQQVMTSANLQKAYGRSFQNPTPELETSFFC
jgi:manganese/iron transport system ATP-binding protein